jgi:hypothetical protein
MACPFGAAKASSCPRVLAQKNFIPARATSFGTALWKGNNKN